MIAALLASLFLGLVATLGDFVWAHWNIRHRAIYGVIHGVVFCVSIGAAIGVRNRRPIAGALSGPIVGVAAAGFFYVFVRVMGLAAMFPAWMLLWICFALLQQRIAGRAEGLRRAIVRGVVAALLSGAAFYAISGIWTDRAPGGPDYLRNFLSWTFAFFPGFAALFLSTSSSADRRPGSHR